MVDKSLRFFLGCILVISASFVWTVGCTPQPSQNLQKTCVDCHADYATAFRSGNVHQPVKENQCESCHRTHGLIGGVYLKESLPQLCFKCHSQVREEMMKMGKLHPPVAEGKCLSCHDPHNAQGKGLLKKEEQGLCFECHKADPFQRQIQHQPLQKGCDSCHPPHGGVGDNLLSQNADQLCLSCHNATLKTFVDAHGGYKVTTACIDCHDSHSSSRSQLLRTATHEPVVKRECDACHARKDSAEPFALARQGRAGCLTCHPEESLYPASGTEHPPVKTESCLRCHAAHASDFRGLARVSRETLCFECHTFKSFGPNAEHVGQGSSHAPARDGDCLACHEAHGTAPGQSQMLRQKTNLLCQNCHDMAEKTPGRQHAPVRDNNCRLCHRPHESPQPGLLEKNQLRLCGDCHDDVAETFVQASLHQPFARGECSACHNPHGNTGNNLLLAKGVDLCKSCHEKVVMDRKDAQHPPYRDGRCNLCHVAHGGNEPFLLKDVAGKICFSCHPDMKKVTTAKVVHKPLANLNCTVCHHGHSSGQKDDLLLPMPELCLTCHDINRFWEKGVAHAPAVRGECGACHNPHFSNDPNLLIKSRDKICAGCHDLTAETLRASHQDLLPKAEGCTDCHDSHGGPDHSLTYPIKHMPFADGQCIECHGGGKP